MEGEKMERRPNPKYFQVSARGMVLYYLIPLPLCGFITCVLLSLIYDFDKATSTHCKVKNYLPSISTAVGDFTPQRYIWRLCIALHSGPRLVKACILYNFYLSLTPSTKRALYKFAVKLAFGAHLGELAALLVLTYVSSSENYPIHEASFISFMVCSLIHMLLICVLARWGTTPEKDISNKVSRCSRWQLFFFIVNITSFAIAVYFFERHSWYCESGVYSLFAGFEYITVITNLGFHGSAAILLGKGSIVYSDLREKTSID